MAVETLSVDQLLPNKFEPKRVNRWVLSIEGIDAYIVKSAARPKFTGGSVEIPFINSRRYVANNFKFETMQVLLHDPIAPSGAQQVMEWIRLHYESVSGRSGYADFYKRDIQLKLLDPVGTVIELWDIKGAFLENVDFGELKYDAEDLMGVTMTVRFDNCVMQF